MELVKGVALSDSPGLLPELFSVLLKFASVSLTVRPNHKDVRFRQKFSLFGEACMENVALTYESSCQKKSLLETNVLFKVVRALHTPLRQKYRCYLNSNWRVAVNVLIKVLKGGIPVARSHGAVGGASDNTEHYFADFWPELSELFDNFLFPDSMDEQKQEDRSQDESIDVLIIELLREEVLPFPSKIPTEFIRKSK